MEKPEHLLSRKFCTENPEVWKNEVIPMLRSWKLEDTQPTITHKMIGWLYNQGWLTRVYTQNIDGLELRPEILELSNNISGYSESIIQAHGSMRDGTVVLYGDKLSDSFYKACENDFNSPENPVDLILVMGTSLQVAPFCSIPNLAPKNATRVLVDPNPNRVISLNPWSTTTKLADIDVQLGSLWKKPNSPWENELLVKSTSDDFVRQFFNTPGAIKKGWNLLTALNVEMVEVISRGKWHLCEVVSKNSDEITVKRCSDGKKVKVSLNKIRNIDY
tara:strand:- start:58 stop:882 length:825 start_codon:yes stop_codon:yes gene_type:complete